MDIIEKIHGKTYKHNVADIEGYVDPTAVITAHKAEADAHTAANITNVPAGDIAATTVQAALNELDSEKVSKAGSLTQITTRNHADLQTPNADANYQHLTTAEVANITLKSGSITQLTTRNHNDLQNLNAGSAHPSASIDNTSTSYGRGLATTDNTVQKIADRVNQNGTPQFVTDKTKCSLLLDFKGTLADRSRAINPIGSDAANKWTDGYVNDSTAKTSATNISCTLKQFEGDEGKFGSGVAVEGSRTNLFTYSDDLTNAAWSKTNCTVILDRILPDGRKLFKVTATSTNFYIYQSLTANGIHSLSMYIYNPNNINIKISCIGVATVAVSNGNKKIERISGSDSFPNNSADYGFVVNSANIGQFFYITSPQLEAGAFPTSYIATGATAVTRPQGILNYPINMTYNQPFTISKWIKESAQTQYSGSSVLSNAGNASNYFVDRIIPNTQNFRILANEYYSTSGTFTMPPFDTNWHHWVLKSDGITLYFYVDNVLITSRTINTDLKINYTTFRTGVWNGNEANIAFFNYALTDAEISQIYNSGLEGKPIAITNPESIIGVGQSLHDTNFITFASGWGISSTYPNKPTISKSSNVALMRGILEYSGTVNSDVTIFTLPVGHRPSLPDTYYHSFVATARDSGSPAMRILRVYGNGDVKLMAQGATVVNPAISLDNINFVNGK